MILRHLAYTGAGAVKEAGEVATRINAESDQDQRPQQRENRLLAGEHHNAGFAKLAEGIQRN